MSIFTDKSLPVSYDCCEQEAFYYNSRKATLYNHPKMLWEKAVRYLDSIASGSVIYQESA